MYAHRMDTLVTSLMTRLLSTDGIETILKHLVLMAEQQLPGTSGADKEAWCVDRAITILEKFDNSVPVLGVFADLSIVDGLEARAVKLGVRRAWSMLVEAGMLAPAQA